LVEAALTDTAAVHAFFVPLVLHAVGAAAEQRAGPTAIQALFPGILDAVEAAAEVLATVAATVDALFAVVLNAVVAHRVDALGALAAAVDAGLAERVTLHAVAAGGAMEL
jgi:hypothetical protein